MTTAQDILSICEFHRTAISRSSMSVPARWLDDEGLIVGDILDFGCGRGYDANELGAVGYDPNSDDHQETPNDKFDTVVCIYVLNVIPPDEQQGCLTAIQDYLKDDNSVAYIAVRRDLEKNVEGPPQWWVELPYDVVKETSTFCIYKMTKDSKGESVVTASNIAELCNNRDG